MINGYVILRHEYSLSRETSFRIWKGDKTYFISNNGVLIDGAPMYFLENLVTISIVKIL